MMIRENRYQCGRLSCFQHEDVGSARAQLAFESRIRARPEDQELEFRRLQLFRRITIERRQIKGLELRVFGEPMDFWKSHMPEGMFLRSPWEASHISDPQAALTMDAFSRSLGEHIPTPIALERFVEYGLWFQRQAVPEVDRRKITRIERDSQGFRLTLNDGEQFRSRRVVIAGGIGSFARRPQPFEELPVELVTHVSDQRDVRRFVGKSVAIIGAGQSALESAALIHEAGGDVEVIVRAPGVHWARPCR